MEEKKVYHERQRLQFCLLHALNNLFQENDAFTRAGLDTIADKLACDDPNGQTWSPFSVLFKPHHNKFTGRYDVNVLIAALEGRKKSVFWHDRRNGASSIVLQRSKESLMGVVLNVPVQKFGGFWKSRHWIALRRINGFWYNLDSDLSVPKLFEHDQEVVEFIDHAISEGGEVFIILHDAK